jgi:hypothetical protein
LRQFWKGEAQSVCALDKIAPENLSEDEKMVLNGEPSEIVEAASVETMDEEMVAAQAAEASEEVIPPSDVNHGAATNMALYFPGAADAADTDDWLTQTNQDGTFDETYEDSAPGTVNAAAFEA